MALIGDLETMAYNEMKHLLTLKDTAASQLKSLKLLKGDACLVRRETATIMVEIAAFDVKYMYLYQFLC